MIKVKSKGIILMRLQFQAGHIMRKTVHVVWMDRYVLMVSLPVAIMVMANVRIAVSF